MHIRRLLLERILKMSRLKKVWVCEFCGTEFPNRWGPQRFCGPECARQNQFGPTNSNWKGEEVSDNCKRNRVRTRFKLSNVVCVDCGTRPAVHRHHMDEDLNNHSEENVRLLCLECHSEYHPNLKNFLLNADLKIATDK